MEHLIINVIIKKIRDVSEDSKVYRVFDVEQFDAKKIIIK
jgi:hypothetical protein